MSAALTPVAPGELLHEALHYVRVMMGVTWTEAAIGIGIFTFQTVTSFRYTKRFHLDYWICLLTFLLCIVGQSFLTYGITFSKTYGYTAVLGDLQAGLHWGWIAVLISLIAATTGKLAIIAFLSEVRGHHKTRPWFLYFIGLTNVIVTIVTIVLLLTSCSPTKKLWDFTTPGACNHAKPAQDFAYFGGAWSAVSDISLALYPIAIVWNLHMHVRMKVGLCLLMGFGVIAGACAIIRTSMLHVLSNTAAISFGVLPLTASAMTEMWITMIVASIPPSRPVIKFFANKVKDVTYKTKTIIRPHGSEKLDENLPASPEAAVLKPYKQNGMFSHAYHGSVKDFAGKHSRSNQYGHEYSDIGTLVRAGTRGIFMTTDVVVEYEEEDDGRRHRSNSGDTEAAMVDRV